MMERCKQEQQSHIALLKMGTGFDKNFVLLSVSLLFWTWSPIHAEKHSLYYIYTALSKPVNLTGIYQFTGMGLLDGGQIDYYNSEEQITIPKQHWMKEKLYINYWEERTQSRKRKEQWFNENIDILMKRMRHSESDLHVFQWRTGCEVEQWGSEVKFFKGVYEYSYDGKDFLSFDDKKSQWVASVAEALPTKSKWDHVSILNQYTNRYLGQDCVNWLKKFTEYGKEEIRNSSPPDVHIFAKRSTSEKTKLKLTCMVTGFYPKDTVLFFRKYRTSLPEDDIESTGVRPNHDGTFQLRKSVEIKEDEKANFDCFVSHITLKEPVIVGWDGHCKDCPPEGGLVMIASVTVAVLLLTVGVVFCILKKKGCIGQKKVVQTSVSNSNCSVSLQNVY